MPPCAVPPPVSAAPLRGTAAIVRRARVARDALDATPLHARVGGVRDGRFVLMELEVNEPGLLLHLDPPSAERFAEATVRRLRAARRT